MNAGTGRAPRFAQAVAAPVARIVEENLVERGASPPAANPVLPHAARMSAMTPIGAHVPSKRARPQFDVDRVERAAGRPPERGRNAGPETVDEASPSVALLCHRIPRCDPEFNHVLNAQKGGVILGGIDGGAAAP